METKGVASWKDQFLSYHSKHFLDGRKTRTWPWMTCWIQKRLLAQNIFTVVYFLKGWCLGTIPGCSNWAIWCLKLMIMGLETSFAGKEHLYHQTALHGGAIRELRAAWQDPTVPTESLNRWLQQVVLGWDWGLLSKHWNSKYIVSGNLSHKTSSQWLGTWSPFPASGELERQEPLLLLALYRDQGWLAIFAFSIFALHWFHIEENLSPMRQPWNLAVFQFIVQTFLYRSISSTNIWCLYFTYYYVHILLYNVYDAPSRSYNMIPSFRSPRNGGTWGLTGLWELGQRTTCHQTHLREVRNLRWGNCFPVGIAHAKSK